MIIPILADIVVEINISIILYSFFGAFQTFCKTDTIDWFDAHHYSQPMDGKVWGFRIIDVLLSTRINIFADFEGKCYDTRTISIPLTII